jgi:glycosyltransferase involved in cell wall biosynthesis
VARHRNRQLPRAGSSVAVAVVAATTLRRHLDDHPAVALSRVLRAAPAPVRTALASLAVRLPYGWTPLALAAAGRPENARSAVLALAAIPRRRPAAAAAALALHDGEAARQVLALTGTATPRERYARALCLRALGFLTQAQASVADDAGRRQRALRRRLHADLAVLSPTGRPQLAETRPPRGRSQGSTAEPVVLHMVTNALPETQAGYTTRTHGIVRALRRQGVDARVAPRVGFPVTEGHLCAPVCVEVDGVPYHRSLPWGLPRALDGLVDADAAARGDLARELGAQLLHAHSNYLNARAALAERDRTGIPVVYEVRGMLEETWRSRGGDPAADRYRLTRASETEAMLAADAVVVISDVLRAEVIARGVPEERVVTVPNAVDETFLAEPPDASGLRAELGFAVDDVVIGTVSTLNDYEGLDVLVDAVGLLRREGLPARLLVVGAGPAGPGLRERASALGQGVAVFPGRVPFRDVRRYHAAIDVFAVPRLDLPVTALVPPLKPLEAMATGRPVVASDLPPLCEIVRAGVTGVLAAPGDAEALARALSSLVSDPDERARLGSAARDWTHAERTWPRAAEHYRGVYHRLGVG